MRIVLAGAAGFIGSNLAQRYLEDGHEVIGIDNLVTGDRVNVEFLSGNPGFTFVERDIVDGFSPGVAAGPIDLVCDLACPASPVDFASKSVEILRVCSEGVRNMLELARARKAVFLHTSTSEVYGDPEVHPQKEDYWGHVNPIGPRSMYDEGKRYAEAMILAYSRRHRLPVRIARIFNTYGPRMRMDDGRVVTNFIRQALLGEPLTVYGDGSQTRSFCYVRDQVEGLVRLAAGDYALPVNIGNPDEFTVRRLAEIVIEMTRSASTIVSMPLPPDDPKVRCPDIALAEKLFGWRPQVPLREGLALTIEYCRRAMSAD